MIIKDTALEGVQLIEQFRQNDDRGCFVKTFHQSSLQQASINFVVKESFYSISKQHVLRGMHFHHSPHDHAKIVFCTDGQILDVALDIRPNSATFGQYVSTILSVENNHALFIPKGFAHGFLTLSASATTNYFVDGEYSAVHDDGILYTSFGMQWPSETIITNQRDEGFMPLADYYLKHK
jgi:dTDP-4-dehydrorhamnose 3,5-epimerase